MTPASGSYRAGIPFARISAVDRVPPVRRQSPPESRPMSVPEPTADSGERPVSGRPVKTDCATAARRHIQAA